MAGYILTNSSVIMCMHGGLVSHIPATTTSYTINGELPMLMLDQYVIAGCSFSVPCVYINWLMGSNYLFIKGVPVLTNTSNGICVAGDSSPMGVPIIASFQTQVLEPEEFTRIDH